MTAEELKTAAEILTYIIACPLKDWFQSWYQFYVNLFNAKSLDIILLTLNRLMKNEDITFRNNNQKLLEKVKSLMHLVPADIESMPSKNETLIEDSNTTNG